MARAAGQIMGEAPGVGITYSSNLLVNQVLHANGILDTQAPDPNAMARPASIGLCKIRCPT